MTPPGYGLYLWLIRNPLVMWLMGLGSAWVAFRVWLAQRDKRVVNTARLEDNLRAQQTARQIITDQRTRTHEVIREARAARDTISPDAHSDSLSDDVQALLFGSRRDGRQPD